MDSKVCVDASFVLKLVLPEDYSDKVHQIWSKWVKNGVDICAPYLLVYETHSVIRNKVYRKELTSEEGQSAIKVLMEQNIILYHARTLGEIAWEFARQYDRPTLYGAFYLAVAKELKTEFWTADKKLHNRIGNEINWMRSVFDC